MIDPPGFVLDRLSEFGAFLGYLWEVIGLSLRASPDAVPTALAYQHPAWLAFSVAMLAGIAQLAGSSIVLFFQHVRPARFGASLVLNGTLYFLSLIVDGLALWLVASLALRTELPVQPLILIACLGSAPLIFDLLGAAGTLGPHFERIFHAWSWVVVLLLLRENLQSSLWVALICLGLARLLVWLLRLMLGVPVNAMSDGLWHLVTGVPTRMSLQSPGLRGGQIERSAALRLSHMLNLRLRGGGELATAWPAGERAAAGLDRELMIYVDDHPAQLTTQAAD